jgi:hypothetical protein
VPAFSSAQPRPGLAPGEAVDTEGGRLWSCGARTCRGKMAGKVIVRQDVLCLHQWLHMAALWPAQCLHTQAGSARRPGRHSAPDKKSRSRAGACTCRLHCVACTRAVRWLCQDSCPSARSGSAVPVGLWQFRSAGTLLRCSPGALRGRATRSRSRVRAGAACGARSQRRRRGVSLVQAAAERERHTRRSG